MIALVYIVGRIHVALVYSENDSSGIYSGKDTCSSGVLWE